MTQTVLILGASGRFGRNAAQAFAAAGWHVKHFKRGDDLTAAARGMDVIVNAWNPPYTHWARDVPGLTRQVIAAAKASDAMVIIPGNVYVFGKNAPERFAEDTAHLATNPLGRIRVEMEAAYRASGVQTIVLRSGDYLDTEASGNWFDMIMAKNAAKGRFVVPGHPDVPRAWAYLPDKAQAAVLLASRRDQLDQFEDVPFPGYTLTGAQLGAAVADVVPVMTKQMSWLPIHLVRPFWPLAKHLIEMRYLWDKPHYLDGAKLQRLLPDFQDTPFPKAVSQAVAPLLTKPQRSMSTQTI